MKDLSSLFASALAEKQPVFKQKFAAETNKFLEAKKRKGILRKSMLGGTMVEDVALESMEPPSTILQLSAIPKAINVDMYKNPHAADNPTGDYKSAYRFSQLADPIPFLKPQYDESLNSTEKIWGNLINGATSTSAYTQQLLFEARNSYRASKLSGMGGIPDDWYPVYAIPSDWYTMVQDESNLIDIEIDLKDGEIKENEFITLQGNGSLSWNYSNSDADKSSVALQEKTNIKKIKLKVLQVDFIRPWLDFEIFNLKNWKVNGLDKGYFSNGKIEDNKGVFPLITRNMLIGTKVTVEGNFDKKDKDVIKASKSRGLCIGPFLLNANNKAATIEEKDSHTVITSEVKQIVGYLSKLIPVAPYLQ